MIANRCDSLSVRLHRTREGSSRRRGCDYGAAAVLHCAGYRAAAGRPRPGGRRQCRAAACGVILGHSAGHGGERIPGNRALPLAVPRRLAAAPTAGAAVRGAGTATSAHVSSWRPDSSVRTRRRPLRRWPSSAEALSTSRRQDLVQGFVRDPVTDHVQTRPPHIHVRVLKATLEEIQDGVQVTA